MTSITLSRRVLSWIARIAMYGILIGVTVVCHVSEALRSVLRIKKSTPPSRSGRLLLMGTFYNLGWFRSHILPLSQCEALTEILVVCDEPLIPIDKVVYRCPPAGLVKVIGRSGARFFWLLWVAFTQRPGMFMGYHIMPNSLMCLVAARLTGGRAAYQMTGGPIQLIGGGVGSENVLLRQLRKPSPRLEALLFHVVRQFDCVIVRGESARKFVHDNRLSQECSIVTGSVDVDRFSPNNTRRDTDIAYVSRLVPRKGLYEFLNIVAKVAEMRPSLRVALVGDGPLRPDLERTAAALGIESNIEFLGKIERVEKVLQRCRLFVLVSPSEGMSIAMIEAMATAVPVVVTDVGDLRDLVTPNRTGMLLDSTDPNRASKSIVAILENEERRQLMSEAARAAVVASCSVEAVARRWNTVLAPSEEDRLGGSLCAASNETSR